MDEIIVSAKRARGLSERAGGSGGSTGARRWDTHRLSRQRSVSIRTVLLLSVGMLLAGVNSALAWNDTGHQIIALIAWGTLSGHTRGKVVDLLRQAPAETGLASMFAQDNRPVSVRQREFFRRASTWPDVVRNLEPADRHAYHHPAWHYRNFFWTQAPSGPVDVPHMPVSPENVIERLHHFQALLANRGSPVRARAVGLGWMLHLVGDIHQPFHCSARVTPHEPDGDQGGNLFGLGPWTDNLHSYWDSMLDRAVPRRSNEATSAYLTRAVALVVARHPRILLEADLKAGKFEDWALESLAEAKAAYPPTLRRGRDPPGAYARMAARVAMERAARSGYRLAALLEELYGQ
jgi:S1/P1 Nuclease